MSIIPDNVMASAKSADGVVLTVVISFLSFLLVVFAVAVSSSYIPGTTPEPVMLRDWSINGTRQLRDSGRGFVVESDGTAMAFLTKQPESLERWNRVEFDIISDRTESLSPVLPVYVDARGLRSAGRFDGEFYPNRFSHVELSRDDAPEFFDALALGFYINPSRSPYKAGMRNGNLKAYNWFTRIFDMFSQASRPTSFTHPSNNIRYIPKVLGVPWHWILWVSAVFAWLSLPVRWWRWRRRDKQFPLLKHFAASLFALYGIASFFRIASYPGHSTDAIVEYRSKSDLAGHIGQTEYFFPWVEAAVRLAGQMESEQKYYLHIKKGITPGSISKRLRYYLLPLQEARSIAEADGVLYYSDQDVKEVLSESDFKLVRKIPNGPSWYRRRTEP
jgi:hypothetical protein